MKPRLLDLFCGAGGAGKGYADAGFDVTGVDIIDHPDAPFEVIVRDALEVLAKISLAGPTFDAIHASPPCQAMTTMSNRYRGRGGPTDSHVNLIPATREMLKLTGLPYIIENVTGARPHMHNPITLSGGAFGLRVNRPRLFESNVQLTAPRRVKVDNPVGIYGHRQGPDGRRLWTRTDGTSQYAARSIEEAQQAMGVPWMTQWSDITEAIPPAYTEHLGLQLLRRVRTSRGFIPDGQEPS